MQFVCLAPPGFSSASLPNFVKHEFERFLDCGVLCRGTALLVCQECPETKLIALSCKGRAFCPSCLGRRMAQTAANLIDHVLPQDVPLRQWVLTFPFELRARLGFYAELLSELCSLVNDALLADADPVLAHLVLSLRLFHRLSPALCRESPAFKSLIAGPAPAGGNGDGKRSAGSDRIAPAQGAAV